MRIIVTGASGYIGGQTLLYLRDLGHEVTGIDQRTPSESIARNATNFLVGDISQFVTRNKISDIQPHAVVHCAGTSLVAPSITDPEIYYTNNFVNTKMLVEQILESSPDTRFIFSSSASVYGVPVMCPCSEVDPIMPISPYGQSKAMIEWMLDSYARAYGLKYVAFRYFNACGADPRGRHGQENGATHIIARILESIRNQIPFAINGDNYPTVDGTCVRDYVHVSDIAAAHELALSPDIPVGVYNLGTGKGYSVKQIVDAAFKTTYRDTEIITGPNRPGDPPELTATAEKFNKISGWVPMHQLNDIMRHAWAWYQI